MKLHEAKKLCRKRLILAIAIAFFAMVVLIVSSLKGIYSLPWYQNPGTYLFGRPIRQLILWIYDHTPLLPLIWETVPTPDPYQWNTSGNYLFVFLFCMLATSSILRDSAKHLAKRVENTIRAAEEDIWKKGLLQAGSPIEPVPDFLTLEIQLEQKDKWHTRPQGIVLLTVIAGLLL